MSLDITLYKKIDTGGENIEYFELHHQNITHNLGAMANKAGIYNALWRPDENDIDTANDLIITLAAGIVKMKKDPVYFRTFDDPDGWGLYDNFLPWLERLNIACLLYPDASIKVHK